MNIIELSLIFILSCVLCVFLNTIVLAWLHKNSVFDEPNSRSSHFTPTLRGGGLAVVIVMILVFSLLYFIPISVPAEQNRATLEWIIPGLILLAIISWVDDLKGVPQIVRLIIHFVTVYTIINGSPEELIIFQGTIPIWLDNLCTAIMWVWFINLFNFMDGIDGMASVESISISIGIIFLAANANWEPLGQVYAAVLAGAMAGFIKLNWEPAKVFLGDVGSIPIGFIIGWLLLKLASEGLWLPAFILPLYYITDATFTLARRILKREKFWLPHKQHYYQRAVIRGFSHAHVATAVAAGNIFLIGFAVSSIYAPLPATTGAAAVVFVLLLYFKSNPKS